MSRKLNVTGHKTLSQLTGPSSINLENYTSYEDEIKSSVELKESSNFDPDFKPDINCTAKLQVSEQIESRRSHNYERKRSENVLRIPYYISNCKTATNFWYLRLCLASL